MKLMIKTLCLLALISTIQAFADNASGYRLSAVRIASTDFQKSIDFYTYLGMKEGTQYNEWEQQITWASPGHGPNIILYRSHSGSRLNLPPGTASLVFFVPDMNTLVAKLGKAGYPNIGEPQDRSVFRMLHIEDPDGNHIELVQELK